MCILFSSLFQTLRPPPLPPFLPVPTAYFHPPTAVVPRASEIKPPATLFGASCPPEVPKVSTPHRTSSLYSAALSCLPRPLCFFRVCVWLSDWLDQTSESVRKPRNPHRNLQNVPHPRRSSFATKPAKSTPSLALSSSTHPTASRVRCLLLGYAACFLSSLLLALVVGDRMVHHRT
jgi:hypothetical protein